MSRNVDKSDLKALEADDLKYLHDRNQITDEQLAEALGASVKDVRNALQSRSSIPLEDRPNTGDANTINLTKEEYEALLAKASGASDEDENEDDSSDEGLEPPYDREGITNDMLRAEIARRNEDRDEDDQLSLSGKKEDLIATLEEDDDEED